MAHNNIRMKVRRRKVAALAAYSRKNTVRNCTIPQPKKENLVEGTATWNENIKVPYTKESANWDGGKWYKEQRDKAILHILKDGDEYTYKGKQNPWYMLDTRKRIKDGKRVNSEATIMYNRTVPKKKGLAWYYEQLVEYKLAKWERKHPCPVKTDGDQKDLFEEEYVIPWRQQREIALERIRDFVVSMYDKLQLTGRFKKVNEDFVEQKVAEIKDVNMEGHHINDLNPETSKVLKVAQKITDKTKKKHPNLVCTNLRDHTRKKGRIILPQAA